MLRSGPRPASESPSRTARSLQLLEDEPRLAAAIRAGDSEAFETVFLAYYEPLYRFVYPALGSREEAEELVQGLFATLWTGRRSFPIVGEPHGLRAYLYTAARNRTSNRRRHERVVQRAEPIAEASVVGTVVPGMGQIAPAADDAVVAEESRAAIRRAVESLPERHREVLALRSDHGLTYAEIAKVLGLSVKTVESHINRAFRTLRDRLAHLAP